MPAGRIYVVNFENVAVSAAQDLFEISPGDDKPIALMNLTLDNVGGTADAGDAQEELLRLLIRRGHTTSGSGGTAPTPRQVGNSGGAAASFAAEVNNTTIASAGTTHDLWPFSWNPCIPGRDFLPEESMFWATQADTTLVVRLLAAPADALSLSGCAWILEVP